MALLVKMQSDWFILRGIIQSLLSRRTGRQEEEKEAMEKVEQEEKVDEVQIQEAAECSDYGLDPGPGLSA